MLCFVPKNLRENARENNGKKKQEEKKMKEKKKFKSINYIYSKHLWNIT